MNAIEKAKDAIEFTLRVDSLEGYLLHPESVNKLIEALAALEAEKPAEDAIVVASWLENAFGFGCTTIQAAVKINSYAESYHARECENCKKEKTCDNCGNSGVACLECSHIQPDNWIPAEDPNTFRRFEKRSGITTDVTDGVES